MRVLNVLVGMVMAASSIVVGSVAMAHEGHIVGDGIELEWLDHTLVGTIDGKPVFADSLAGEFGIRLLLRSEAQTYTTEFRRVEGVLRGELVTTRADAELRTNVVVTEVVAAEGLIKGTVDADSFVIKITAEAMEGSHYVNPTFALTLGDKEYRYHMEEGQVCIGCSTKIAFAILATKRNNGTW